MAGPSLVLTAVFCVIFLCGVYAAQRLFRRDTAPTGRKWLFIVLAGGLLVRLALSATTSGHPIDINTFSAWAGHAAEGLTSFYSPGYFADYPPGYIYVLWIIGKLRLLLGLDFGEPAFLLLLKLPAVLADMATAWVIYGIARRHWSGNAPLAFAGLYAFNPAVILDSAIWGQVDSVLTLFIVLGVFLLAKQSAWSAAAFALALLVKPQALIFAPVPILWFAVRLMRERRPAVLIDLLAFASAGLVVFGLGVLPFAIQHGTGWVIDKYIATMASYPYASFNAFNLFALAGGNGAEMTERFLLLSYSTWGTILLILSLAFAILVALRAKDSSSLWYISLFLSASVFMLSVKMHERYLFPAMALALGFFIVSRDRWVLWVFAGFSATQLLNIAPVLALSHQGVYLVPPRNPLLLAVSLANVVLWAILLILGYFRYVARPSAAADLPGAIGMSAKAKDDMPIAQRFGRPHWILLACLILLALFSRIYRLDTPRDLYWDEVYFGFTAHQHLANDANAYDPWAASPPGKAYEWTHPPLGKLIMAGTMALTSSNPWGMRLSSVLFGTTAIALVVLVGYLLTRSPPAALLAGLLYAVEGLNFVQSRVATVDIHQAAFILAATAFYIAWRRRDAASNWLLLGAGAMAGAAISIKWSGVLLIVLLGADLLVLWLMARRRNGLRTILTAGLCLLIVPAAVYLASYTQFFLMGYGWNDFTNLQQQMWFYHAGLKATHPHQSVAWQWLLNLRPVWLYVDYLPQGRVANIYNLGNSVVLYFGLIAVAAAAVRFARRRGWEEGFLLAAYLIFWLPSAFSPRIMFFYHYLPATAFLCIASGWLLSRWVRSRSQTKRIIAWIIPILVVMWFGLFYPHMTAIPVPSWWADNVYFLIPSWR